LFFSKTYTMEGAIVVKAKWKDDLRRLTITKETDFVSFRALISKIFNLNISLLKYVDDEGDEVSITSDEELKEAFRIAEIGNQTLLRVFVSGEPFPPPKTARELLRSSAAKLELGLQPTTIVKLTSSTGEPEVIITEDELGNTKVELVKEQISLSLSQSPEQRIQLEDSGNSTKMSLDVRDGNLNISQLSERTTNEVSVLSRSTFEKNMILAEEATQFGNKEREEIKASTIELSRASAERVAELSKSIAESTEKAANSASLLGDELIKLTLSNMKELSDETRDRTSELSRATVERLDEVLRAFKQNVN